MISKNILKLEINEEMNILQCEDSRKYRDYSVNYLKHN